MKMFDEPYSDKVFHQFLALQSHSRRYARQLLDENGLTPRDFSVLHYLMEIGAATVGQIQSFVHKSSSTTSAMISQLEEKGYVTRTRSQEDNRVVIVTLTPFGQDVAKNTPLGGLPLLRRRMAQLSKTRLEVMEGVLKEISDLMEVDKTD